MNIIRSGWRVVAERVKGWEPIGVFVLAAISGGVLLFQHLASEVLEGETQRFDESILLAFRQPGDLAMPIGPFWLTHAVNDITSLGGTTVLALMTVMVTVFLLTARRFALALFVFLSVLGGWVLSTALKLGVARPRPDIVPHLVQVHDMSFPSGHAMLSAVTYLTLGVLLAQTQTYRSARVFMIGGAVFLTVIIGCSRVYLGVHYPTDVLGGWCAGATWALCCWIVARRHLTRNAAPEIDGKTRLNA